MRVPTLLLTFLLSVGSTAEACSLAELNAAQIQWKAQPVPKFEFDSWQVQFISVNGSNRSVRVRISNGRIETVNFLRPNGRKGRAVPQKDRQYFVLSPEALYQQIQESIEWAARDPGNIVECTFDPVTGFPLRLHTDSTTISDSYGVVEFSNFSVIP